MTAVIAGCGDLGTRVGLRLTAAGHRVVGIRRSVERLPDQFDGIGLDLRTDRPDLPDDADMVVFAMTSDQRTAAGYRAIHLDGVRNVVDALPRSGRSPAVVFVSSTSVYGDTGGDWVDETSVARPGSPTAEVLLEAEHRLQSLLPQTVVLRLAGLYGPGRGTLVDRVRAGTVTVPSQRVYTNRIHVEDAASAIVHLLTGVRDPTPLYIGADHEPVDRGELLRFIADRLGAPRPPVDDTVTGNGGKRCRSDRLRATGLTLRFPSYREGYTSILADRPPNGQ